MRKRFCNAIHTNAARLHMTRNGPEREKEQMKDSDDELENGEGAEIGEAESLLSMQIAQHLRTMIATDELKRGECLRERTLAERLDVSRTPPLREALKERQAMV